MSGKILCIEDDDDACGLMSFVFQDSGFEVTNCVDPLEGIRLARSHKYAAVIMDYWLDGMEGVDLCRAIRTVDPQVPIVFYTGEARETKRAAALEAGAQAYLVKPDGFDKIRDTVIDLIGRGR